MAMKTSTLSTTVAICAFLIVSMPQRENVFDLGEMQLINRMADPDTSLEAAMLELMVLRVALPLSVNAGETDLVSFNGGSGLPTGKAAYVLSGLSKPLVCTSTSSEDGTLLVDCKPITTVDEDNKYLSVMGALAQHFGAESERDSTRYVRVVGRGEARRFSINVIRQWSREYVISHTIGFGHWPAHTPSADGEDVEEVLELLHIDDATADSTPEL
ncbi:MAG: hypothetical protein E6J91_26900 [Deltaproteobacteria bacterium]|nr:MAG: hypothetical protein E6J91_26900 [Deltaproteobacteria bacterium]